MKDKEDKELQHKVFEYASRGAVLDFLNRNGWDIAGNDGVFLEYQTEIDDALYWTRIPPETFYMDYGAGIEDALITISRAYGYTSEIETVFRIIDAGAAGKCIENVADGAGDFDIKSAEFKAYFTDALSVFAAAMIAAADRAQEDSAWVTVAQRAAEGTLHMMGILERGFQGAAHEGRP